MRIYRIYAPFSLSQSEIILNKESSHHLVNVLRCREGELCHVFDGHGNEVKTKIAEANKSHLKLDVLEILSNETESSLKIHLFQALCKGDKMDVIIQKSIELGVTEITPLITERCDVKLSGDRLEKRMEHWRNIIINATEQSGRAVLAKLNEPILIQKAIQQASDCLRLFMSPHVNKTLSNLLAPVHKEIALFIGPEGGFSESETNDAMYQGVNLILLGKRILRTETASVAMIASLQTLWGDFK